MFVLISMLGINNDHIEAATMTPEAKPKSVFCKRSGIFSFMKKTKAAPIVVPKKGMSSVKRIPFILAKVRNIF
jgi:hypothetical protein